MPEPHLRVVDEHGELHDECPNCQALETEKRGWRIRYQNAVRDKKAEAQAHDLFPAAKAIFDERRRACRHPNSKWTADRFWQIAALLEEYGPETCKLAIAGAAYDPATRRRRNGTIERFDSWELIFRNPDKMESFCNRAPIRRPESDPKPLDKRPVHDPSSTSGILPGNG